MQARHSVSVGARTIVGEAASGVRPGRGPRQTAPRLRAESNSVGAEGQGEVPARELPLSSWKTSRARRAGGPVRLRDPIRLEDAYIGRDDDDLVGGVAADPCSPVSNQQIIGDEMMRSPSLQARQRVTFRSCPTWSC